MLHALQKFFNFFLHCFVYPLCYNGKNKKEVSHHEKNLC